MNSSFLLDIRKLVVRQNGMDNAWRQIREDRKSKSIVKFERTQSFDVSEKQN